MSKHAVYLPIDEGEKEARSGQIDVESLAAALHGQATGRGSSHPIPIAVVKLATSRNAASEAVD